MLNKKFIQKHETYFFQYKQNFKNVGKGNANKIKKEKFENNASSIIVYFINCSGF